MLLDRRAFTIQAAAAALALPIVGSPGRRIVTHSIFELRNYSLKPGRRDELIALFEREFVESQEAAGAGIVGTFRDLDAPDRFVWLRSFANMEMRGKALSAFYSGPVWRAHRESANATMVDVDDVYLLHSIGKPLSLPKDRPSLGTAVPTNILYVNITPMESVGTEREFVARTGKHALATFATEQSANNFPALPVRNDLVYATISRSPKVTGPQPIRKLRLQATSRSLLR
jgi:hypothetical protein